MREETGTHYGVAEVAGGRGVVGVLEYGEFFAEVEFFFIGDFGRGEGNEGGYGGGEA